jgi:hypothetical protein
MTSKIMKYLAPVALVATAFVAPDALAQVAAPDTADTVTYLETNGPVVIAAIGGVMLTLAGVAVLFKWAKASVFG